MKRFILCFFLMIPVMGFSQGLPDVNAKSPKPERMTKVEKKALKKKQKMQRKQDKGEKKLRKQLVKMQTKDVKKRMRQNKHKAKLYNMKKKEFFLVRWFRKKSAY
jgi:hypothetical protein